MSISNKLFTLGLGLVLLATVGTLACQTSPTTKTRPTIPEILSNIQSANAKVQTLKYGANITLSVEVTGGNFSGVVPHAFVFSTQLDNRHKKSHTTTAAYLIAPEIGEPSFTTDLYLVDGWEYGMSQSPNSGGGWWKSKGSQMGYYYDQLSQQMQFLKTATNVSLLQDENVDGTNCYVLTVNPDMKVLFAWVFVQWNIGSNLNNLDPDKIFKASSVKEWIAKDTYLPVKTETEVIFELPPYYVANVGPEDFEYMTVRMKKKSWFFDYNQPLAIDLPEAARGATLAPPLPD